MLVADGDRRTYVGITLDVKRRLAQHNGEEPGGAKATRSGRPWRCLAVWGPFAGRGDALSAEYRLKLLSGAERRALARRAVKRGRLAGERRGRVGIPKEHRPLFRAALPDDPRVERVIPMFGGVAAIVQGHMACGLWAESVVVRVGPKEWVRAVKRGGEPFSPMGTTVMKDQVVLPRETIQDSKELGKWLQLAIDFTATLPYEAKKKTPSKK